MNNEFDMKKYIADLKSPWKTMGSDMDTALHIIDKHIKGNTDDSSLELISILDDEYKTTIRFPDWQSEIERAFIHQYGPNNGKEIFKKVIMRFYLLSKGTAQQLQ